MCSRYSTFRLIDGVRETQNINWSNKTGEKIRRKGEKRQSICNYYGRIYLYLLTNYIKPAWLWLIMQMDQQFLHACEFELSTWSVVHKEFQMLVDYIQTRTGLSKTTGPLLGKGSWYNQCVQNSEQGEDAVHSLAVPELRVAFILNHDFFSIHV